MLFQSLKMAWSSILSNKMRSFLTMLGVIIGVIALVVLVSVVSGATGEVTDVVSSLGTNLLTVRILDDKERPLSYGELEELRRFEELDEIAPYGQELMTVRCGSMEGMVTVTGTTPAYNVIEHKEVEYGRNLNGADVSNHLAVAVVNQALVREIMKIEQMPDAIGGQIHLKGIPYTVVGIVKDSEDVDTMFSITSYTAQIPFTSLIRLSSSTLAVQAFLVSSVDDDHLGSLESEVGQWLLNRLDGDEDAFILINMSTILGAMDQILSTMTTVLGGIAAISLLVGGIGIMNIMLVSVTERTREIGIRKAIGAGQGSILIQFLIEALMLSMMGCIFGVIISWGMIKAVNIYSGHNFGMGRDIVVTATVFSMAIGVIFGIYPARKAAKKKPIDALHYGG